MWFVKSIFFSVLMGLSISTAQALEVGLPALSDVQDVLFLQNYNTRLVVISVTLLGMAAGVVGAFLLLRKRSLMGDALAHSTLPGIVLAFVIMVLLGGGGKSLLGLNLGATVAGLLGVLVMLAIRNKTRLRDDVAMGFVLSVFFGAGIAILGIVQKMPGASAAGLESFIYGKVASMVMVDFVLIAIITVITTIVSILLFKELTLLCFDEHFASSQGMSTFWLDLILLALVTAVTVIGLQAVGLILIIAFLITPPASARFWTDQLGTMTLLSAVIGALSGWIGASASALLPRLPAGAMIVLVSSLIFIVSMIFAPRRGVFSRWLRQRELKRKVERQHLLRAAFELVEQGQHLEKEETLSNVAISRADLLSKRTWQSAKLDRILRKEAAVGHLEFVDGNQYIQLSESGFGEASRITRNHRLWEIYLVTHADIAPSHVDRDADMVEHVLDADLVKRLEMELRNRGAWIPSPHTITPAQTA